MKAVLCPVCSGRGNLPEYEIGKDDIDKKGHIKVFRLKHCHGCGGLGWVSVPEDSPLPFYWQPGPIGDNARCPSCGGDRNTPPVTGCPMGSHYGTSCLA